LPGRRGFRRPGAVRNPENDHRGQPYQEERQEVLTLMRGLGPYGAEAGQPCDGDWCACDILTDEWAAEETP
jgi:hypothetical protein